MLIIDIQTGRILGSTQDTNYSRAGCILQSAPDSFDMAQSEEWNYNGTTLVHDLLAATTRTKTDRISQIKTDATKQIEALAWRIERAQERDTLGLTGETVNQVLLEKEAIRRAGNRTENVINALSTIAEIQAVVLEIKPEDIATAPRVSRLEFLRRFNDTEMNAFVSASKANVALEAYLMKLQNAEGIVLTDPATVIGVQALEMMGIIATGRATVILAV